MEHGTRKDVLVWALARLPGMIVHAVAHDAGIGVDLDGALDRLAATMTDRPDPEEQ